LILINFIETLFNYEIIFKILIIKLLVFFSTFITSFILYQLKIIGGADGKVIIYIFCSQPSYYLNIYFFFFYFLIFSILFIIFFALNLVINFSAKNSIAFIFFFNDRIKIKILKRFYFRSFFRFINFTQLNNLSENAYQIYLYLIYNHKIEKFQVLCQIRPPLIIICAISYIICFFFN